MIYCGNFNGIDIFRSYWEPGANGEYALSLDGGQTIIWTGEFNLADIPEINTNDSEDFQGDADGNNDY